MELVQQAMHSELSQQVLETTKSKAFCRSIRDHTQHKLKIYKILSYSRDIEDGFFVLNCQDMIIHNTWTFREKYLPSMLWYT